MGLFRKKTREEKYWDNPLKYGLSLPENKGLGKQLRKRLQGFKRRKPKMLKEKSLAEQVIEDQKRKRRRLGGR